jgi:pimeloyl-ACP methyl ester carboxylesterase
MPLPPPPGVLIDIGTHRLHLHCLGEGTPTVVFDAALGGSSLSWSLVQPEVARVARACTHDRAGFGWSEAGPLPRTAGRIADELHTLLHRAGVAGPYLLVGHSFGGLVMRLFATRHRRDVAGLVLIEPAVPEDWLQPSAERRALIARGERLCRYGEAAARSGVARVVSALARAGALTPARVLVKLVSRGGLRREDEGILAPIWKLPPDVRRMLGEMWTQRRFFAALGSQIANIGASSAEVVSEAPAGFGNLPLAVITAADARPERLDVDGALASRSTRGRHVLAPDSGHWVPLDAPRIVSETIVSLLNEIRAGG